MTQVEQLRQIISSELRFPLDRLKLVKGGKPLDDNLKAAGLSDGGKAPPGTPFCAFCDGRCICARRTFHYLTIVLRRHNWPCTTMV